MAGGAGPVAQVRMLRFRDREALAADDVVCVEEPLEITVGGEPFYMTMRLPGQDMFLAVGLLFTEGLVSSFREVASVGHCPDSENRVDVYLADGKKRQAPGRRGVYSSCGICGKELISDICTDLKRVERTVRMPLSAVFAMQKAMETKGPVFDATGGTHMAALFAEDGTVLAIAEDVGRHNALDKAIGRVLFESTANRAKVAVLSSRLSYEMVQKAGRLGIEVIAGASAPTSLAIGLAAELEMTLMGFLRPGRANIYTASGRITTD